MDVMDIAVKPVKEFAKDSYRLVKRCTKPDRKGACASEQPARRLSTHTVPRGTGAVGRAPLARVLWAARPLPCGAVGWLCLAARRLRAHRRTRAAGSAAAYGRRCVRLRSAHDCHAARQPACTRTSRHNAHRALTPERPAQSSSRLLGARGWASSLWASSASL